MPFLSFLEPIHCCRSGQHVYIFPDDAALCCNGWVFVWMPDVEFALRYSAGKVSDAAKREKVIEAYYNLLERGEASVARCFGTFVPVMDAAAIKRCARWGFAPSAEAAGENLSAGQRLEDLM